MTVGSDLSYPGEMIETMTAREAAKRSFPPLSVLLAEEKIAAQWESLTGGIDDALFIPRQNSHDQEGEVRCLSFARLGLTPGDYGIRRRGGHRLGRVENFFLSPEMQDFCH